VRELSLGDYVLNGGEVAALAMVEAVVRLLPGFLGNAESLAEESHAAGLLEYPVYTKPARWRGHEVPEVLLSGDHARIAAWRHDQSVRRTARRRPDLLHPSAATEERELRAAQPGDAGELLTLQRACWVQQRQANQDLGIDVLTEDVEDVRAWIADSTVLVLRSAGRLVGAVRGRLHGDRWEIGRLMVAPDLQGRGLGRMLLGTMEGLAPPEASTYELFVGSACARGQRLFRKSGYRSRGKADPHGVRLVKPRGENSGP
jgi:tRNA (guanine37-N1)-methyltransferase